MKVSVRLLGFEKEIAGYEVFVSFAVWAVIIGSCGQISPKADLSSFSLASQPGKSIREGERMSSSVSLEKSCSDFFY